MNRQSDGQGGSLGRGRSAGGGLGGGPQSIVGFAIKGIASVIGLVSEGLHSRKESKNEKKRREAEAQTGEGSSTAGIAAGGHGQPSDVHSQVADGEALEVEWALDDAQDDIPASYSILPTKNTKKGDPRSADQIVDAFLQSHMSLPQSIQLSRLECPVLLPQRRPKDRSRGFIRAYAPSLEPCGINQEQWLAFLDTFEKSSQANPWIKAVNLASIGAVFMPSVTVIAVSIAIQAATGVAIEGHARYKTNNFLEKVNRNYFQPRGLFCLLMTWNPESSESTQAFDMSTNIVKVLDSKNKFKSSSAKTYGEAMFPDVAPLVFPGLDHLQNQTGEDAERQQNKLKKGKAFVDDYMDRRAAAKYAVKNPDSVLATSVPAPKFTSRYADPSHPASSGDLVALITGGKLSAGGLRGRDGGSMNGGGLLGGRGGALGGGGGRGRGMDGGGLGGALGGGLGGMRSGERLNIKKDLKNVLYLLVVNIVEI